MSNKEIEHGNGVGFIHLDLNAWRCIISFQADVVITFPEEDAPSTVQSKNLFVPKPEIQVQSRFYEEMRA